MRITKHPEFGQGGRCVSAPNGCIGAGPIDTPWGPTGAARARTSVYVVPMLMAAAAAVTLWSFCALWHGLTFWRIINSMVCETQKLGD